MVDISSLAADIPVLQAFDEALEVIAERSLIALRAASASISRWDGMTMCCAPWSVSALLESKTYGTGRFSVGVSGQGAPPVVGRRGYRAPRIGRRRLDALVPAIVGLLDSHRSESTAGALELRGIALCNIVGAAEVALLEEAGYQGACRTG